MSHELWSGIAFVLGIAGYVPYNLAIIRGHAHPRISSWAIWTALDWASLAGMLSKGELNGVVLGFSLGAAFTLSNAWWHSKEKFRFDRTDKICMVAGALSLVLWIIDGHPARAVVLMAVGLIVGNIPTLRHVIRKPRDENLLGWILYVASVTCGLLAVPEWTVVNATTPLTLAINDYAVLLFLILSLRRIQVPSNADDTH